MKKLISTLLLSTCLLTVSIFAGDTPSMGFGDTPSMGFGDTPSMGYTTSSTQCVHGESIVAQVVCYFLGD